MLTPIGLMASMFGTMLGFVALCWMGVTLADFVMHLFGRDVPVSVQSRRLRYRLADVYHPVCPTAGDAVYSSEWLPGTHLDPFMEISPASLREQLGSVAEARGQARFDAEGKFRIEPSEN